MAAKGSEKVEENSAEYPEEVKETLAEISCLDRILSAVKPGMKSKEKKSV